MQLFKNAHFYTAGADLPELSGEMIEEAAKMLHFTPVLAQSVSSSGFEPIVDDGPFMLEIGEKCYLLRLREDKKSIPTTLLARLVGEKVAEIEKAEGRKVGRKERADLKENITFSLLPQAFPKTSTVYGWLDLSVTPCRMVVGATSANKAEEFISKLRQALGSLPVFPAVPEKQPAGVMNEWIRHGEGPDGYIVDGFATLDDADGGEAKFDNMNVAQDEEVIAFLDAGFNTNAVRLCGVDGTVEFVLTGTMQMKKIKAEIEYDGEGDHLEYMAHCTGVLRLLIDGAFNSAVHAFGGLKG